ncbi:TIGR02270 family protein [Archangium violaceum]|uniref:TIGR02270 family protein n=1 Tax=Archangium violaceum TaxID=83451 RepID=UPI002B30C03C|nr:TIGR02270 family protein [Archangium violaceum]
MGSAQQRDATLQMDVFRDLLNDAAFLWTQREQRLTAPDETPGDVAEGPEERLLAHLDALVLGGAPVAEELLLPALAGDEAETVICAALALLGQEGDAGLEAVLGALAGESEVAGRGAARALSLSHRADIGPRLVGLLGQAGPALQEVILDVLSFRRQDPGLSLDAFLSRGTPGVQRASLRAARSFPWRVDVRGVERALASQEPAVRLAALETGLVLGLRAAWPACLETVKARDSGWERAAMLLALGGEPHELSLLLNALREPSLKAEALQALGYSGRVEVIDTLLEMMTDEELAPLAGEAFCAITGLVLEGRFVLPPEEPSSEDDSPVADVQVRPKAEEVARWWEDARHRFEPQRRYLLGRPYGWEVLRQVLAEGPMSRRPVLALELAIRSRGSHQLDTQDWVSRQMGELLAVQGLPTSQATMPFRLLPAPVSLKAPPTVPPVEPAFRPVYRKRPPPAGALAITGLGMVSSLGYGVVGSCAVARTGMTRPGGLDDFRVMDPETREAFPATGHVVPHLTRGFNGLGRMVRLGMAALDDLRHHAGLEAGPRTGLFLNLSSGYFLAEAERRALAQDEPDESGEPPPTPEPLRADVLREKYSQVLLPRLRGVVPGGWAHEELFFEDSPGLVSALRAARRSLQERRVERCIVGCIDSRVDPEVLAALGELGVLKVPGLPVGLMPGEGAAFFLVESSEVARRRGAPVQAFVDEMALTTEPFDLLSPQPKLGVALTSAIEEVLGQLEDGGRETGLVLGDLNGTEARAHDWGCTLVRLRQGALHGAADWYPSLGFGDVGAATGAFSVCMAARGFARGYAPSPNVLVWLWGEGGSRGALYVRAPEGR